MTSINYQSFFNWSKVVLIVNWYCSHVFYWITDFRPYFVHMSLQIVRQNVCFFSSMKNEFCHKVIVLSSVLLQGFFFIRMLMFFLPVLDYIVYNYTLSSSFIHTRIFINKGMSITILKQYFYMWILDKLYMI